MAESFSVERRKLMRFLGAKVVLTPGAERAFGMVSKAQELAKAKGWFMIRQFENEANPDIHERTTAREIITNSMVSGSILGDRFRHRRDIDWHVSRAAQGTAGDEDHCL